MSSLVQLLTVPDCYSCVGGHSAILGPISKLALRPGRHEELLLTSHNYEDESYRCRLARSTDHLRAGVAWLTKPLPGSARAVATRQCRLASPAPSCGVGSLPLHCAHNRQGILPVTAGEYCPGWMFLGWRNQAAAGAVGPERLCCLHRPCVVYGRRPDPKRWSYWLSDGLSTTTQAESGRTDDH